ncbi:flagellar basal body P-ring formation chaperone FlgA [Buchnera aphidicola]|uniref:Flagella basal body P-ring formation protein FlgA n=1 Tax=Buchnera aphidicola subsp. Schizaphis graminum (strain Sg) TaxID=198804 RepID=FLGA_BUCAP|nr:flagellar basal body P-ring formation chaperone FlgA [Buchnera aphidicola]Q8K9L0.1 RecName: Full=Flagella basal body P-ring formation protein FlgA; Flags: Precursor [Buchnera aphidicola str. Sg (Schizaphis graminum)]AAM67878.1 flagella basal body P-ring formation protein [Buchnera aphidicola str. Sg (Schizaphis graminum)]AWI49627.1 flagellar basal body P-ring formation protein FlgA [Buchnera aphidicola (Schizaphis graminum)]
MKLIKIFFCLFIFFLFFKSFKATAYNLSDQLNNFFKKEYSLKTKNIKTIIHTPLKKNFFCKKPVFSLVNNLHNFGIIDIILICGSQHKYLQVELQAEGEYVIAKKKILRGTKIRGDDLIKVVGRLDTLPRGAYLNEKDLINRVNLRDIFPFQPITSFMTRPYWLVKMNQLVTVKMKGVDFEVIFVGKSLSNGAERQKIRVQLKNGKVLTGVINNNSEVIVFL